MNWRPGLFRLWIVGSVLFVIAVAFISYADIKAEFASAAAIWPDEILVPVLCANARGVAEADYIKRGDYCWYAMSIVRRLYPEYKDLSDNVLMRKAYAVRGIAIPTPNPWATLGMWVAVAFGIPLVVLILGSSLVWAFSGFAAKRP